MRHTQSLHHNIQITHISHTKIYIKKGRQNKKILRIKNSFTLFQLSRGKILREKLTTYLFTFHEKFPTFLSWLEKF